MKPTENPKIEMTELNEGMNITSSIINNSYGNYEIDINGLDYSIRTGVDKSKMLL